MKIKLNYAETELAKIVGRLRFQFAVNQGRTNMKKSPDSDLYISINGAGAEIAFAKAFNVYPTLTYDRRDDYDCIYKNYKVDVKCTKYCNGRLLVMLTKKNADCHLYALVSGELPDYNICGFSYKDEIICEETISDVTGQVGYSLTQDKIRSVEELVVLLPLDLKQLGTVKSVRPQSDSELIATGDTQSRLTSKGNGSINSVSKPYAEQRQMQ